MNALIQLFQVYLLEKFDRENISAKNTIFVPKKWAALQLQPTNAICDGNGQTVRSVFFLADKHSSQNVIKILDNLFLSFTLLTFLAL